MYLLILRVCHDRISQRNRKRSVPKRKKQSLDSTVRRVSRVLLGSTLLLSVLWVNIPFAAIATGPMCTLACCVGRAPHAAGSCMNGSCHAVLASSQKLQIHQTRIAPTEQLCGLTRVTRNATRPRLIPRVATEPNPATSKTAQDHSSVSTGALTKPCQPDCGSCPSGFAGSNRQRNAAALAYADRPRPPSGVGFGNGDFRPTPLLSALCRRGAPRGPPPSFS